jgi:hypothetical protein
MRVPRIELGYLAWEASVLPLYYTRMTYKPDLYRQKSLLSSQIIAQPGNFDATSQNLPQNTLAKDIHPSLALHAAAVFYFIIRHSVY